MFSRAMRQNFSFVSMVATLSRNLIFCFGKCILPAVYLFCLFVYSFSSLLYSFLFLLIWSCSLSLVCFLPCIYISTTLHLCFLPWPCLCEFAWGLPTHQHCATVLLPLAKVISACLVYFQCSEFYNSFQKFPLYAYDGCSVHFWKCEVLMLNLLFSTKGILVKCWQMLCQKYIL